MPKWRPSAICTRMEKTTMTSMVVNVTNDDEGVGGRQGYPRLLTALPNEPALARSGDGLGAARHNQSCIGRVDLVRVSDAVSEGRAVWRIRCLPLAPLQVGICCGTERVAAPLAVGRGHADRDETHD
eukprot:scaffold268237_cov28-Tisochrysis_lutea.AAC.3